jgi:hypothetical protein
MVFIAGGGRTIRVTSRARMGCTNHLGTLHLRFLRSEFIFARVSRSHIGKLASTQRVVGTLTHKSIRHKSIRQGFVVGYPGHCQ